MGDQANALLLTRYERRRRGGSPVPRLGCWSSARRAHPGRIAEAATLGVHITVQQALLDRLSNVPAVGTGADRGAVPVARAHRRCWRVDQRGHRPSRRPRWLRAVRRHPAPPADVLGPEHAIGRAEPLRLYTVAGGFLSAPSASSPAAGTLVPGAPADLACPADPFSCADEGCSASPRRHRDRVAYRTAAGERHSGGG